MTRKQQRIFAILIIVIGAGLAVSLSLFALRENVTYFYTPTDIIEGKALPPGGKPFRLGGLVADGSVRHEGAATFFIITDLTHDMAVRYKGIVPDLFREGQGVIATGTLADGAFNATRLLAKHDENYMPPEVAKALEKSGKASTY